MTAKKQFIGSQEPATKGDLEQLREDLQADMVNNFVTKEEFRDEIGKLVTREEFKKELNAVEMRLSEDLKRHFDAAVEIMREEILGARDDEISAMKDKDAQLDERVTLLEKHASVI